MRSRQRVELCLASHHFFPTHGGATLRFLRYFPGLRERGIYTRVVTGTPKAKKLVSSDTTREWYKYPIGEILPTEEIDGTSIVRIRLPDESGWQRSIVFNQAVLRFCQQLDYRPGVVQLLSSLPPRTLPWLIRLRWIGIPTVYAYTTPPKLARASLTPLKQAKRKLAYRALYSQLDCIIVQSTAMRDLLLDLGVGESRMEIIPNGVNLQRFRPALDNDEKKTLRASLGIGDKVKIIMTIGSVTRSKGCDLLMEAWAKLAHRFPETHLVIVGPLFDTNHPEHGEFRRKIDDMVATSRLADRVHFPGYVQKVEDYLRAADIFVFPSLKEAMPNVVLEAMASGLPVILTPVVGLPEEFGKAGQEYLLVKRNPEAFAAAISELLQNGDLRKKLGRQGRNWVEKTMDVERSLDRYATLYNKLADRGSLRHRSR